jgi:2-C-methyl-D-erythritol 4-phosphate cytidylyltransferase
MKTTKENRKFSLFPYLWEHKWSYVLGIAVLMMVDLCNLYVPQYTGELIDGLLDRNQLFRGQAPESFRLIPYYELNRNTPPEELGKFLADHELCFHYGWKVHCIIGEETNFKLTTPDDIDHMISLLRDGKA